MTGRHHTTARRTFAAPADGRFSYAFSYRAWRFS